MNSYAGIMPCLTHPLINDDGRMAYGDYAREVTYAAGKVGIQVQTLPKQEA